jgi:hypothetical protein
MIAAIAGGSSQLCALQNQYLQVRNQFKQLGQDLQAGNLGKSQSDFVTLSQAAPVNSAAAVRSRRP